MDAKKIKLIGYLVLFILILNLVFFAFVMINWVVFWSVLILAFIFVKWGLPKLKEL